MQKMPDLSTSAALILAGGKGTRMRSSRPKALQRLLGSPMLAYVQHAVKPLFQDRIFAVAGHGAEELRRAFPDLPFIIQTPQLGTGHAVQCALKTLEPFDHALVLNVDTPLVRTDWLVNFISRSSGADVAFATVMLPDPASYGRVVRADGQLRGIVEAKDFNPEIHGAPTGEINTGIWWLNMAALNRLLPLLTNSNRSGEYYLTDLVELALERGLDARGVQCGEDAELLGINTPPELVAMEEGLRAGIVENLLAAGVIIHAPNLVRASPFAKIEAGVEICGPCEIYGHTIIHAGAVIESHCVLENCEIKSGAVIHSFSHISNARIGENTLVGPYSRLRPGAVLEQDAHVGNFVEIKNASLGAGAKANHLSYLGDAEIGAGTNIGAGTITCNYDGKNKHRTTIGEKTFIGSNTALVAPVSVGDEALVGAGSVITHDIPAGEMGIARARQKNLRRRRAQACS